MQPGDAATRQQYGLNLLVLGRFDDAARELGRSRPPRSARRRLRCRTSPTAKPKLGRPADARAHAHAALAIDPADPLAQQLAGRRLALIAVLESDADEAVGESEG